MKPSALRIERLLAKVEAELARSARPRRYCFYFDEEAEAKAQGLPYILVPRVLSEQEWIVQPEAGWRVQVINEPYRSHGLDVLRLLERAEERAISKQ